MPNIITTGQLQVPPERQREDVGMTQRRSRRLRRPAAPPTFEALAQADGARVDDLLREVSQLRLALDTDLTIAAAAAEAASEFEAPPELSAELTTQAVDAGRSALEELTARRRLGPAHRPVARRRIRGVPLVGVGPLVGVAIVLGIGTGFFARATCTGAATARGSPTTPPPASRPSRARWATATTRPPARQATS